MKDVLLIYDLWGSRLPQYYLKKCEMEVPSTVKFLKILSAKNDGWVFSSREILLLVKMISDKINFPFQSFRTKKQNVLENDDLNFGNNNVFHCTIQDSWEYKKTTEMFWVGNSLWGQWMNDTNLLVFLKIPIFVLKTRLIIHLSHSEKLFSWKWSYD